MATFGNNTFSGNVICHVKDRPTIDQMMDWDKGQMVTVSGSIDHTTLGDLVLNNCAYTPHPGQKG